MWFGCGSGGAAELLLVLVLAGRELAWVVQIAVHFVDFFCIWYCWGWASTDPGIEPSQRSDAIPGSHTVSGPTSTIPGWTHPGMVSVRSRELAVSRDGSKQIPG